MKRLQTAQEKIFSKIGALLISTTSFLFGASSAFAAVNRANLQVKESALGFKIPTFADIITFLIRFAFVGAGVMALLYLLMGAFSWITSGGEKEKVEKARDKLQAAIVGVILVVVVVALVATLEQVVFGQALCLGLTCPATIPTLLKAR